MKAFLVGGTHSGVGKTTVSIALMAAFKNRGLSIQPFKVGPDYIDSAYHTSVTGIPSINLDSWLLSESFIRDTFHRHMEMQDLAIVEGVMGLFDGFSGTEDAGSSAHIAKILGLPVILVIDAHALVRSAAAFVKGFASLDPKLQVAGVIFNRVASAQHFQWLKDAVQNLTDVKVLGYLPSDPALKIPERHLGLTSVYERGLPEGLLQRLAEAVEKFIDLDQILKLSSSRAFDPVAKEEIRFSYDRPIRIGIARDQAFCFYYQDNFDLLRASGAELVFFSPLEDPTLPEGLDGLYFGGGFPELFAEKLARAEILKEQIRSFVRDGKPIYAECGGLMFLTEELIDLEGKHYPMVGAVPGRVFMTEKLQACGYREVVVQSDSILAQKGEILRGHEFHWSRAEGIPLEKAAYQFRSQQIGYADHNLLASYVHLHFGTNPKWIIRWLSQCHPLALLG